MKKNDPKYKEKVYTIQALDFIEKLILFRRLAIKKLPTDLQRNKRQKRPAEKWYQSGHITTEALSDAKAFMQKYLVQELTAEGALDSKISLLRAFPQNGA